MKPLLYRVLGSLSHLSINSVHVSPLGSTSTSIGPKGHISPRRGSSFCTIVSPAFIPATSSAPNRSRCIPICWAFQLCAHVSLNAAIAPSTALAPFIAMRVPVESASDMAGGCFRPGENGIYPILRGSTSASASRNCASSTRSSSPFSVPTGPNALSSSSSAKDRLS